jgi:thiol-disulfide isomerase/thioredoxin
MADQGKRGGAGGSGRERQSGRARAAQRRKEERRKAQLTLLAVVGGLAVLVLAVFALWSASGDDDRGELSEVGTVTMSGDPLPEYGGDPSSDSAVGTTAPTFTATDLRGGDMTVGPDGRTKVLIFLAHWCPHCQAEVPLLQSWVEASGGLPADIDLISIATGLDPSRGNYPPSEWLFTDEGWQFPVAIDNANSEIAGNFGLSSYPYYVALNGQNQVIARSSGELTIEQWEGFLATARAGAGTVEQGEGESNVDGTDTATTAAGGTETSAATDTSAATETTVAGDDPVATEPEATTTTAASE